MYRQGPYISVKDLDLAECSINQEEDWIGLCSGKHLSGNGSGEPIEYVDHQTLW